MADTAEESSGVGAAAAYGVILIPPALLAAEVTIGLPSLAFVAVVLVSPVLRPLIGEQSAAPMWSERAARVLELLPFVYALTLVAAAAVVLASLGWRSSSPSLGLALSLWITLLLATCPAHELLHRRGRRHRFAGAVVAGLAGYPILGLEHMSHHRRPGDVAGAEWPAREESVWRFAWRRTLMATRHARTVDASTCAKRGVPVWRGELALSLAITLATCLLFGLTGGWLGLALYLAASAGVVFGVQVITYIQHWGLGFPDVPVAEDEHIAWEDTCRLQGWLTLQLSLHQAHHRALALPYYRVQPSPNAPRAPAGYVVLMFLALIPPIWRKLMTPSLEAWQRSPNTPAPMHRRITCF